MIYVGYQATPVPGKLDELLTAHRQAKDIAEANGASQIGAFQVAIGPDAGSLFYIVGYKDVDAYAAVDQALADTMKQAAPFIASSSSAVLKPLPESGLQ